MPGCGGLGVLLWLEARPAGDPHCGAVPWPRWPAASFLRTKTASRQELQAASQWHRCPLTATGSNLQPRAGKDEHPARQLVPADSFRSMLACALPFWRANLGSGRGKLQALERLPRLAGGTPGGPQAVAG